MNFQHIDVPYNQINEINPIIDRFINFKNKAIYIEPRFNNPTGRSLTNEQKKNIITYSERHNIPIIEDDIFRDIFFSDPVPAVKLMIIGKSYTYKQFFKNDCTSNKNRLEYILKK